MRNLQLSLKTKWFEMTKAGIKTEDYREINYYWFTRLVENNKSKFAQIMGYYPNEYKDIYGKEMLDQSILKIYNYDNNHFEYKSFNQNTMTLGYPKSGDTERIIQYEHAGIEIKTGNPEWGAEPGKLYFVIKHGNLL